MTQPANQNLFSISKASSIIGVSPDTLRRLEVRGRIVPKRGINNERLYSLEDINLLKQILKRTDVTEKTLPIQEAAKVLNVSPHTIRRWENEGKITSRRTPGGHRFFTPSDLQQIQTGNYVAPSTPKVVTPPTPKPTYKLQTVEFSGSIQPQVKKIEEEAKQKQVEAQMVFEAKQAQVNQSFNQHQTDTVLPTLTAKINADKEEIIATIKDIKNTENNREKGSRTLNIALFIIILILLGVGGKFTYDQTQNLKEATNSLNANLSKKINDVQNIASSFNMGLTEGSVIFKGPAGIGLSENNNQLFWDNRTAFLGIGTNTPESPLEVSGVASSSSSLVTIDSQGEGTLMNLKSDGASVTTVDDKGNLTLEGSISDLSDNTVTIDDSLVTTGGLTVGTGKINSSKSITITSSGSGNDINLKAADDITFDDSQLTSSIKLTENATALAGGQTGIVDAINNLWNNSNGTWVLSNGVLSPVSTSTNIAVGGTNSSAKFYIDASNGNTNLAGNFAVNSGNINSASTINITPLEGTGVYYRDSNGILGGFKDQGDFVSLFLKGKGTTGDPATCTQGDIYYNITDDKVRICTATDTWDDLSGSGSSAFSAITSGTNTTAAMVVGSGASLTFTGTGTITASDLVCTTCVANSELANSTITFAADSGSSTTALGGTRTFAGGEGIDTSESGGTITIAGEDATAANKGIASFSPSYFTVTSGDVSITNDSLDFTQFNDTLTLDASTDIALGALTLSTSGTGLLNFSSTGQVTFAGNTDVTNGLDVTNANLTVGGSNFYVSNLTGNITTAGDIYVNGGDISSTAATLNISAATNIRLASATNLTGLAGNIITTDNLETSIEELDTRLYNMQNTTKEMTGFPNRTDTTLSFNDSTPDRTFTITGTNFKVYSVGKEYNKNTESIQISTTHGIHYIYYDKTTLNLSETTGSPWSVTDGTVQIATVYWNGTNGLIGDERHGLTMDGMTHEYLHNTVGTRYDTGLAGTFADTTFSIDPGSIYDEDIKITTSGAETTTRVLYKNGSSEFTYGAEGALYYYSSGGNIYYNNGNTLTAAGANEYVAYWIFATNDPTTPIYSLMGQRVDTNLTNARNNNKYESLSLASLPFKEMKILYRVILRNDATPYEEALDLRSISNLPAGTFLATSHNTLTGLTTGDDHTQYALLAGRTTGQTLIGSIDTNTGLTLQSTSGVGAAGADITFKVGNNGGTEAMRILNSGNVGIGDATPASLFTVGSGDLFQIDSSGRIVNIDNVAHIIDDVSGDLTLTSNSTSVVINDDLAVNGGDLTSTGSLNITPSGALTVGATGQTSLLQGTTVTLTANGAGNDITANLVDDNTDALDIQQGANNYININTTNNSEKITIGNSTIATTNVELTKGASGNIIFTGFNCTGLTNGGVLTADASGNITCSDDDGGAGATSVPWSGLTSPSANLALNHTATGQYTTTMDWTATGALSPWTMNLTNNAGSATNQYLMTLNNAVSTQTTDVNTEALLVLDNADTNATGSTIVDNAILITNTGAIANGITDAIDVSASDIVNAINVGANVILGTTANIDFNNFDVVGSTGDITTAGDININGGNINSTGSLTVTPGAGTNLDVSLSTTGDFTVNTNQLYVDTSAANVGIGAAPGAYKLDVGGNVNITDANYYRVGGNRILTASGGAITLGNYDGGADVRLRALGGANTGTVVVQPLNSYTTAAGTQNMLSITGSYAPTTGGAKLVGLSLTPTINQTGTANGDYTALHVNVTETAATGTNQLLADFQTGSVSKVVINSDGNVGIGDSSPLSPFTVGSGDLFQIDSSGRIVNIDNVAHIIDDVSGDLTLTSNSTSVVINDDLAVNGGDLTSSAANLNIQIAGTGTTGNVQIGVGGAGSATPDLLVLDVKSDAEGAFAGTNGAMYYNANTNKFRCYEGGAWGNCIGGSSSSTLQNVYDNDADGSDAVIALTTADDSLIFRNPAASGTDSGYILKLDQLADAAVDGLQVAQAGTGAGLNLSFTNAGTTADGILFATTNALTDAIDVSDADVVNAINIGANTILGTAGVVDFNEFDVSGSTGSITINDGGDAGNISIEGTILDIDSLDFVGAGTISTGNTTALTLNSGTTGAIDIGNDASAESLSFGNGAAVKTVTIGSTNTTSATTVQSGSGDLTLSSTDQVKLTSSKASGGTTTEAFSVKTSTDLDVTDEIFQIGDSGGDFLTMLGNGNTTLAGTLAVNGDSITADGATLIINAAGNVDVQDALNADSITSDAGVSIAASNAYTGAGAVTLSSGGAGALTLDSASNTLVIAATDTTLSRTAAGTYTVDLVDGSDTTLALTNSGAGVANFSTDGDVAINGGDLTSTAATLNIQVGASGASTIGAVQIGVGGAGSTTPDYLGLDVKSDTGDPAGGAEGYMYYNTFDNKFRCYQGAAWTDCIGGSSTLQTAYDTDANGSDTVISLTTDDDSLIIRNPAASGTDSAFLLQLDQLAATSPADGLLINSSSAMTDAIDVSDTDITNGINLGANFALFDGVQMFGSAAGTVTIEDTSGNDLARFVDIGTTGNLIVTGSVHVYGEIIGDSGGTATISFGNLPANDKNYLTNGAWQVNNSVNTDWAAFTVNQAQSNDIFTASASGVTKFTISNAGNVSITGSGTMLTVGGGTGKVDMGTIDPVYNIGGTKYATYMSAMTGVKEETTGLVATNELVPGYGYRHRIDFKSVVSPSDLWLFAKATDIEENIDKLILLLSPEGNSRVWYTVDKENYLVDIYSSEPTQISYRMTAPRFDHYLWDNFNYNPDSDGFHVDDTPIIVAQNGEIESPLLPKLADFEIQKVDETYEVNNSKGNLVTGFESLANFVAGNIKSGAIETQEVVTQGFVAFQGTVDSLLIRSGLVTPVVQTALISPLPGENIAIDLKNSEDGFGELIVKGKEGSTVAAFDAEGNATISGELTANEASIAGELRADKVIANEIIGGNTMTREEIEKLLADTKMDEELLTDSSTWEVNTASGSANLDKIVVNSLFVTGNAGVSNLSVTGSIAMGTDMVIASQINSEGVLANTLNSLTAPLQIQSLGLAPVEIMAGLIRIDTKGNMQVAGDLLVKGSIEANTLTLIDNEVPTDNIENTGEITPTPTANDLLKLQNAAGQTVVSVNASGSANFKEISAERVQGSTDTRDFVELPAEEKVVRVTRTWNTPPTSIMLTPSFNTSAWVTQIDETGFTINVADNSDTPERIYWWAIW